MAKRAEELLERVQDLPPLPAVAARVMGMAEDDNTTALEMAQVLSTDQALTAKLIRMSNSAYYGFARRVSTVREALLVLGFKQTRQVAVSASIMNTFKAGRNASDPFDLDLFWGHSVAVAVAAEAVARHTHTAKPEEAFTAGILHDIGRLVMRQAMPMEFQKAVVMARDHGMSLLACEVVTTQYVHDDVGRALAECWKFPTHLIEAIERHHDPRLNAVSDGLPGVVAQCDRLAEHYGLYCGYDVEAELGATIPADLQEIEDAAGGIDHVLSRAFAFIEAASHAPERWYAAAA